MIKLTNKQASDLLSPVAKMLFDDPKRRFPVKDMFTILGLIQEIETKIGLYHKEFRNIISKYDGLINEDGSIVYENPEKREKVVNELNDLSNVKIEYPFDKLTMTDDWPKLSLTEAVILKPLLGK